MEHHGAALHLLTKDEVLVETLKRNYKAAKVDEKTMAMLDYAVKLTEKPTNIKEADVALLKEIGCTDREILDLCQITSYFNFVNRLAEGLGVQLEDN
jgi:uncharacterized peroxidase-related enzyme